MDVHFYNYFCHPLNNLLPFNFLAFFHGTSERIAPWPLEVITIMFILNEIDPNLGQTDTGP